ncbi:MAG TPA: response regulator [Aggregatilineales bacterium]|nr:response regulator [Anaerolineales bacterium]HRE47616.1 response regulator [Aggregatilineales bacterium]
MNDQTWRILLAEDSFDDVQLVTKILTHYGIEVHHAANGVECLAMLFDLAPDLVITDLAMPEMDGWQTLQNIRADARTEDLPVIAIIAYHSTTVAEDAQSAGFNAYFSKPISPTTFVQSLRDLLLVG